MKQKVKEWLTRYLPPEMLSVAGTLVVAYFTFEATKSGIKTALAATWADNLCYYGYILALDIWKTCKASHQNGRVYNLKTFSRNIRALLVEFGVAEIFDSFLVRPALMYYLPLLLGSLEWGILAGKLLSDLLFYIPTVISYELSKKKLRNFN